MDYTDYDALIKALRHCAKQSVCNGCPRCGKRIKNCNAELDREAADAIVELSEECRTYKELMCNEHNRAAELAREKEHQWIPVTERLPEKYEQVLTYGKYGFLVDNYIGEFDGEVLFAMATHQITHWMPLPQPPKEETE